MIEPEKCKLIFLLHQEGMSIKEIARRLSVGRNTVRAIIRAEGSAPTIIRKDKIEISPEVLGRLYTECDGRIQRIHEKLVEEEKVAVGYSTLTRLIRELGLGGTVENRCHRVADKPGAEMQHDTSLYRLQIDNQQIRLIGSLIYLRYSKIRYLKFYRFFNRFNMQCFFHEALSHWGFAAAICIIDNTNLARLRGTGKNALIVVEMEQFARRYGFEFVCHELGHANRKAGNERSFYTVETNFFPGRNFSSIADLNHQALEWSTIRMANRPVSKSGLIPAKAFEHEQLYLVKIVPGIEPPYRSHIRATDQYGYAAFAGNYYWVPGSRRADVTVLEYSDRLKIYQKRELMAEYKLLSFGVKNQLITPEGMPMPAYKPRSRKRPTEQEEKKLRVMGSVVDQYLNFALQEKGMAKHRFIRQLFFLSEKIAPSIFISTIERALKYRISDMETIERICLLYLNAGNTEIPYAGIDEDFESREAYQQGRMADSVDLSVYDWWEEAEEAEEENG
jgi:transposase